MKRTPVHFSIQRCVLVCGFFAGAFLIAQLTFEIPNSHPYMVVDGSRKFPIQLERDKEYIEDEIFDHVILWWTPFTSSSGELKKCGRHYCLFTNDKALIGHTKLKAFLFYGSRIEDNLPVPRGEEIWGLIHEESPRNKPLISHKPILSLFNVSSTFSRKSHVPLTYQYLLNPEDLISTKYYRSVHEKDELQLRLSPVVYIQSDCITPDNRDSYVAELMKYIPIDSYGSCLNNKKLPDNLKDSMSTFNSPELMEFVGQYKFAIAFENAACNDYITEKFWRPLIAGAVPIYYGSPTITDFLPNPKSSILVSDFKSPKDLADHLHKLNSNPHLYSEYLTHKTKGEVENKALILEAKAFWGSSPNPDWSHLVDKFECYICEQSYNKSFHSIVTQDQYDCPQPVSMLSNDNNVSNWWHSDWRISKCQAVTLRQSIDRNMVMAREQLNREALDKYLTKQCSWS